MTQHESNQVRSTAISRIIHNSKYRRAFALVILACCTSVVFAAGAHKAAESESSDSTGVTAGARPASSPATLQGKSREPVKVVRFSLYDVGIYPREVHVDHGLIALLIEDYWGSHAGVVVERETESAPQLVGRVEREGPHWRSQKELQLTPGRYQVYMAERPDNRALLVIEP
jgi:hypothetical protein